MSELNPYTPPSAEIVTEKPAPRHSLLKILLPLVIVVLAVAGFRYLLKTKTVAKPKPATERTWNVAVHEAQPQTLAPMVTLYGRTEAPQLARLSAALSADVQAVPVRAGETVAQGAVLVQLDPRDGELLVQQRRADVTEIEALLKLEQHKHAANRASLPREKALLAFAEKAVARAQRLEQRKVASESAVDEARQAVERQKLIIDNRQLAINSHTAQVAQLKARQARAEALLQQAQRDFEERTVIRAPLAGVIAQVNVAPGDRVRTGDALLTLYAQTALEIRAQVPHRYRHTLRTGLNADARLYGTPLSLVLDRFAGENDSGAGGTDALFRIANGAEGLRLGDFLTIQLHLPPQTDLIALPYEALYSGDRIYKLVDGRMRKVTVKRRGETYDADGKARVLLHGADLQAGDQVVVSQLPNAMDGLKVEVEKQ